MRIRASELAPLIVSVMFAMPGWADTDAAEQLARIAKRVALAAPTAVDADTDPMLRRTGPEAMSCGSPCVTGTLSQTGNGFFELAVDCATGSFTARTGASHPAGASKSILFGGDMLAVGASGIGLYDHGSSTLYRDPPGGQACAFDPPDTSQETASRGLEQEWSLSPAAGVDLTLRHELVAFGTGLAGAGIRSTLCVTSALTSPSVVDLGLRWQLDYEHDTDDGPLFSTVGCSPIAIGLELSQETDMVAGDLSDYYRIRSNNALQTLETFTSSSWISGWPGTATPDRLVYGQWATLDNAPWSYVATPGQPTDLDAAVLYYLGSALADAIAVAPGATECRSIVVRSEPRCNCGNGVVDPGEECDDGNEVSGDGCSSTCESECAIAPGDTEAGAPKAACPGVAVALDDSSATPGVGLQWDDGGAGGVFLPDATSLSPTYTNANPGTYTLTLTATDTQSSCQESDTVSVTMLPLPIAVPSHPTPVCFGCDGVQFVDLSIGSPTSWQWDLGDGTTTGQQHPLHIYGSPGTYDVTLTVTNGCGVSAPVMSSVDVVDLPSAAFDVTSPQCVGSSVVFTNQSSADASSFVWDFGDGSPTVTDRDPIHTFPGPGVYIVEMRASNPCGEAAPVFKNVRIVDVPVASFTSDAPRCIGPVQFEDTSSGVPTQWSWDFGDGSPFDTTSSPSHVYAAPGTYDVTLSATNACGSSAPFMGSVTVDPALGSGFQRWNSCTAPRAFGTAPSPPYSPENTTVATTQSTSWEFDDGTYCRATPCTFAMYAVADCGTAMIFPLYDNETGRMRIFDILGNSPVTITANGGSAACPWSQVDVNEVMWQDCVGSDCRWNNVITTVSFTGQPAVCGVYRLEFVDWGGFWWDLFANCDGSSTPGFTIFDNICDAIAAYNPVPELSLGNLAVTGVCPDYTATFDVMNSGCVTVDAPVRLSSTLGASLDVIVTGLEPGVPRQVTTDVTVASCVPGDFTIEVDPDDVVAECSETAGSAVSCNAGQTIDHVQTIPAPPPCLSPPIFCGATDAWDLDACADTGVQIEWPEVIEAGSGGAVVYDLYRDDVLLAGGLTATQYVDTTGTNGVAHRYRVQAVNTCGLEDVTFAEVTATDEVSPAIPPDFGNTLYAIRWFQDAQMSWLPPPGIVSSEVLRDTVKDFSGAAVQISLATPGSAWNDVGVVSPTAGRLLFYRVRGVNCAGQSGP